MFWLFVLASFLTAVYAFARHSWRWLIVSAILYSPFVLYLSLTPRFVGAFLVLPIHLAAAFALRRNKSWLAGLLLTPSIIISIWLALIVITQ